MKPVRIASAVYVIGPLQCPKCGARFTTIEAHGILRLTCPRVKQCRAPWTAIRLPPGATGQQLEAMFGLPTARALMSVLVPDTVSLSDGAFLKTPLPTHDSRVAWYVQRASDVTEPPMGWLKAHTILSSIMGEG